ncbi:carbohydrate-binding domain-containing protein, partial [Eubacteriales bacterium OttesenSCG-928-N14]|nr:carbohydrate-binding domain-containing protein [Eubacteriales bacterium OttesenSCG-928-N14]
TYDAGTGTLTLTDFKDTTNPITWNDGYLNIVVNGDCEVPYIWGTNANCGILTISGTGTLTVTNPNGHAIYLKNDLVVDGVDVTAKSTITGGAGAFGVHTYPGSITVKNSGTLSTSSIEDSGIYIFGGNLNVESNGSVVGTNVNNADYGIYVFGNTLGADYGNITVDGGSVKGEGEGGIQSSRGNITLISGSITGIATDFAPGIVASRNNNLGGKITVKGGTLTGTSTYTISGQYASGIRAEYGMEITGGKVVGENMNEGAAAVHVEGAALTMSGGELEATNTATAGMAARGILSEAGITMTGNSKMTGITQSNFPTSAGICSGGTITMTGDASNMPEMIGEGKSSGIYAVYNYTRQNISLTYAKMTGTGGYFNGIYCDNMTMTNSIVTAQSEGSAGIWCSDSLDVSGTSIINAKGTTAGIVVLNLFKVRGKAHITAVATGATEGGIVIQSYGSGIYMNGTNRFDVDLEGGIIIGKGVKGIYDSSGPKNDGAGIQFDGYAADVVPRPSTTKIVDDQVLIAGTAADYFKHAYGKDGERAAETIIYADVDYAVTVKQNTGGTVSPSSMTLHALKDQKFTITPAAGCIVKDIKVNGESQGSVTEYTLTRITADTEIEVEFALEGTLTVAGLPTTVKVGDKITLTPSHSGGVWVQDSDYWTMDQNSPGTYTAKKAGSTTITYELGGQKVTLNVTIRSTSPATGDRETRLLWIALMAGAIAALWTVSRKKRTEE